MSQLHLTAAPLTARELDAGVAQLRADLTSEDGPRISTMRNFRFAILAYAPEQEFRLRSKVRELAVDLRGHGWVTLSISLQKLFLQRLRAQGDDFVQRVIARERRLSARKARRARVDLADRVGPLIEGPDGLAADVISAITAFADAHPHQAERAVVFIGRAGALYPWFRTSALLKHIDGRTGNVPVVLLYPGKRRDAHGLSFMGEFPPDTDYRPRIYPT